MRQDRLWRLDAAFAPPTRRIRFSYAGGGASAAIAAFWQQAQHIFAHE
jgi:hypothetical protein